MTPPAGRPESFKKRTSVDGTGTVFFTMTYRTIVLYVAVQSMVVVVVVASPTVGQQHGGGEPIAAAAVVSSPFHHRPTPASKIRGIPEVGKLPRTATTKKHPTAGTPAKPNSGINHLPRSGRNPIIVLPQSQRPRYNHFHLEDSHQRPKTLMSNEERAEKINSDLEKMIQFMSLLGQVDQYLSSRAKSIINTLSRAMENNSDDHRYNDKDTSPYDY